MAYIVSVISWVYLVSKLIIMIYTLNMYSFLYVNQTPIKWSKEEKSKYHALSELRRGKEFLIFIIYNNKYIWTLFDFQNYVYVLLW